jgi:hypothetical protein
MDLEDFVQRLTVVLQDAGPGIVAELTDTELAYWDGQRLVYASVSPDGSGTLAGEFVLDAQRWSQWKDWLGDWLADPAFGVRDELRHEPSAPLAPDRDNP